MKTSSEKRAPAKWKVDQLDELTRLLGDQNSFLVSAYSGLSVEQIADLRHQIREHKSHMKVVKNNLFKIALSKSQAHSSSAEKFASDLKGPIAVTFSDNDELPVVAKVLVDYSKKVDKVALKAGFFDGAYLGKTEVAAVAGLPSKGDLLSIIARGLNTPTQKIAFGMNEIMSGLARAIQAVGEKNG